MQLYLLSVVGPYSGQEELKTVVLTLKSADVVFPVAVQLNKEPLF